MKLTAEQMAALAAQDPSGLLKKIEQAEQKNRSEESFLEFVKGAWHVIEPQRPLVVGWAIEAICDHLEAVDSGEIKNIVINVPPGMSKSVTTNLMFPAWQWGPRNKPSMRYLSIANRIDLSIRDQVRCRDVINSDFYQRNWGDRFGWDKVQNGKEHYKNDKTGSRIAYGITSAITGERGDGIIIDDPHSVSKAESSVERRSANQKYFDEISSRTNDENTFTIVIMQRLHEEDLSGSILEAELGFDHLMLPMRFEPERKCYTSIGFQDPRKEDGDLLFPERFSEEEVNNKENTFRSFGGEYAVAGQHQQAPIPRGGGMFAEDDLTIIDQPPGKMLRVCRGWDLASTAGGGDYTVGVKIGEDSAGRFYIMHVERGQWSPLAVEGRMNLAADMDGKKTIISVPQDPGAAGKSYKSILASNLVGYNVKFSPETGSKETRATPFAAQVEAGNVYLVKGSWNKDFIDEAKIFPNGRKDDQIDAASRAFNELIKVKKKKKSRTRPGATKIIDGRK